MDLPRSGRLRLRHLCMADAPFLLRLLTVPEWLRHIGDKGERDHEGAREDIASGPQAMYASHGHGLWLVEELPERTRWANALMRRRQGLTHPDLGFAFLPEVPRSRPRVRSRPQVLGHARFVLALDRVLAIVQPVTVDSVRLLLTLGFRHGGVACLPGAAQSLQFLGLVAMTLAAAIVAGDAAQHLRLLSVRPRSAPRQSGALASPTARRGRRRQAFLPRPRMTAGTRPMPATTRAAPRDRGAGGSAGEPPGPEWRRRGAR